jgi:cytochrome bd-type quinol oxidase subunit 2
MIFQQEIDINLEDIIDLILLIIVIILVAIFLYFSLKYIAEKEDLTNEYIIRLLIVSFIIVVLVALVIGAIISILDPIPFISEAAQRIVPILIFLAIAYLIKFILIPERDDSSWNLGWESICVAIATIFLIYLINAITFTIFDIQIISGI